VVLKRDMREASEETEWRLGSREFQTDGTATEKARKTKYEKTAGFKNSSV